MNNSFGRFGGYSAIVVGALSLLYAILYLGVTRVSADIGTYGSWVVLAASGIFSSAAFVALYSRTRSAGGGFALWATLLGVGASLMTFIHGGYEVLFLAASANADPAQQAIFKALAGVPSQVDPAGMGTFLLTGLVVFIFSTLMLSSGNLPKNLGILGMVNGVVLVILFLATATAIGPLILAAGGLTSVILGPIWWIWLGTRLLKVPPAAVEPTPAA